MLQSLMVPVWVLAPETPREVQPLVLLLLLLFAQVKKVVQT